jgi:hypothetical protein
VIVLVLALQAAAPATPPLGAIGRQALPAAGCAAYLWSAGPPPALVAYVAPEAASLRVALDGKPVDLPRASATGPAERGFAPETVFAADGVRATLAMRVQPGTDLIDGARVPEASLAIERPGRDGVVVPLAGLVGCAGGIKK